MLATYFPTSAATLDAARAASLADIPDGAANVNGLAVGEAAAAALIALRADDGSVPPEFFTPPSTERGVWQPTPSCPPAGGVLRHWRNVTPFGIPRVKKFRSVPPPKLTSRRYARDLNELKEVGGIDSPHRSTQKADVAQFFAAVLAVGTWNPAVALRTSI